MIAYKIESFIQSHSQPQTQPEVRCTFEMRSIGNRENAYFNNKRIVLMIKDGMIQSAILLDLSSHSNGYILKTTERQNDSKMIVLEDEYGMIRLMLKENDAGLFEIAINHPLNIYSIVPFLH